MKNLKATLTRHFTIATAISGGLIAFMGLPFLEAARANLATVMGFANSSGLWLPTCAIILTTQVVLFRRSLAMIAEPLSRLAKEVKRGEQGFAFKTKSRNAEEDSLKHAFEAANLKARELQEQADELELDLEKTSAHLSEAKAKAEKFEQRLETAERSESELRQENERLKASKVAIELTLENERRSKVGIEVEKRTEEIYAQMERAVAAAAFKAIWVPSLVQELKAPISVIHDIAKRLKSSWNETSFALVNEEIERICAQSQTQLDLIEGILAKQPKEFDAAPASPTAEETAASTVQPIETEKPGANFPPPPSASKPSLKLDIDIPALEKDDDQPLRPEPITIARHSTPEAAPEAEATLESPYALKAILKNLVEEFSPLAPDAHISYSIDDDLEIEVDDESLLSLFHALVETAVSIVREGEITIGIDLKVDRLAIDVACDGALAPSPTTDLSLAQRLAKDLNGCIEVDRASESELHLTFEYSFSQSEPDAIIDVAD